MDRTHSTAPIILVGTGRSGSTAMHRLLSHHPDLGWLSGLCDQFPDRPRVNQLMMHAVDLPIIGQYLRRKYAASEAYVFWQHYSPGFGRPCRDLTASDLTNRERRAIVDGMENCLTRRRSRLLLKVTGWPRIGYLAEVFPAAKFIHLIRDGRAVANSMLAVGFWDGWHGPDRWRWSQLSNEHRAVWDSSGQSFVALAGIEWVMMLQAAEKACQHIPASQYLEVRYEDFCENKIESMRRVADFADLAWNPDFERIVNHYEVSNTNFKWRSELTDAQSKILEDVERHYLAKYGYI